MALLTRTQIRSIAPTALIDNQVVRQPTTGTVAIPTNLGYRAIEVLVNLTTADKRAVGKTLAFEIHTADGSFVAGYPLANPWTSYGHQYTVTDPDGAVHVDPDPTRRIALANLAGQQIFVIYQAIGIATAGLTVSGLK
jgi:hypothetical protein